VAEAFPLLVMICCLLAMLRRAPLWVPLLLLVLDRLFGG